MHCTCSNEHGSSHGVCSVLWSNARKIRVLQEKLEILDDRKREIETLIKELGEEK
ncbi:hypothetical protein JW948_08365 [bacterium]|nr:hypothetical protein [bacterium]